MQLESISLDKITVKAGVVIGKAGNRDLKGDLYLPPKRTELAPAMLVIHGGGWRKGSPQGVKGCGEYLCRCGFVCLAPEYRLSGEAHWPAQLEDVKCAIRYLRANAESLGVDPDRIGAVGDSAGGHLALMTGLVTAFEGLGGHEAYSSSVSAVGALYAPVRVGRTRASGEPLGLLAPEASDRDFERASPLFYDLGDFPPCLLIHGAEDTGVPLSGTLEWYRKLTKAGRETELHVFAREGHAFDRRSSVEEGLVDILDPTSVYGYSVTRLIGQFFLKFL